MGVPTLHDTDDRNDVPYFKTNTDLEAMAPHLIWQLDQVLSHIGFEDLLPTELVSLLIILAPVHSRVLTSAEASPERRLLRLVRDDD